MKLRLSNSHSFAVEFSAANEVEYRRGFARTSLSFFTHEGKRAAAYLNVASDSGVWFSPYFPESNNNCVSYFGRPRIPDWSAICRANQRGTWVRYEIDNLAGFISS